MCDSESVSHSVVSNCDNINCNLPGSSDPWNSPGKNTGVGCYFLLQGIFLTQGLNLHHLHWQADSLPVSHLGSPSLAREVNKINSQFSSTDNGWLKAVEIVYSKCSKNPAQESYSWRLNKDSLRKTKQNFWQAELLYEAY